MARRSLILSFACLLMAGGFRLSAAEPAISFNHQIRPLLSDRCFTCHGPDENARKGKLRLDLEADSRKPLDDGWQVVKPGDPDKSEVVRRILSTDPDEVMPPPDSNLKLSPEEKALLEAWIEQGAQYEAHWSFIPVPAAVPVPAVTTSAAVRNPIDAFVQAKLAAAQLKPAAEADRTTLIRRLSFDLTGLPPS
ncbi:MAG TPA: c-type cytochrome domain-containing protein, partial [Verrucomicrobiae bacterium]|nr:c-type cytochrome domain-containing protein [Verrucomicrobiae bacterium]